MKLLFSLVQAMSFFLFVAYVYCKSPAFKPLKAEPVISRYRLFFYLFFSAISIMGTYLGFPVQGAIANTRAIGPVLAGIMGGPLLGTMVGITGGLHRYFYYEGFTALACGVSTATEGLIGGLVHLYVVKRLRKPDQLFDPMIALATTAFAELVQMAIILLLARPFAEALALVKVIGLPMIIASSLGATVFMSILRDRKDTFEKVGADSAAKALSITERTLSLMSKGLTREAAQKMAAIIHQETGVGAVAITDAKEVLAFVGQGSDHHHAGAPIASPWTRKAIAERQVAFIDGDQEPYRCPLSSDCPLHSALVVPLVVDDDVVGTIKLYEPAHRRFRKINQTLGEGLTTLLSGQLLRVRYQEQKNLLVMSELKLARAQVNPHFLFNSLNTIMAMIEEGSRPHSLLNHLSNFFRANLKRSGELSTLREELEHVNAYLEIEKARFEDRLRVEMAVDPSLLEVLLPTFTLQPLVENAIKHGVSDLLGPGLVRIRVQRQGSLARIDIEDNAGSFQEKRRSNGGLGLQIVDRRIRSLQGSGSGIDITCIPNELTRVSLEVPIPKAAAEVAA